MSPGSPGLTDVCDQVWPLVKRSTVADQLARSDLPYLEQYVRQAGFTQMNWDAEKEGEVRLDDSPDGLDSTRRKRVAPLKTYTHWALLKATWSGRGKVVLSCEHRKGRSFLGDGTDWLFTQLSLSTLSEPGAAISRSLPCMRSSTHSINPMDPIRVTLG